MELFIYYLTNSDDHILNVIKYYPKYSKPPYSLKTCRRREVNEPPEHKKKRSIIYRRCIGYNIKGYFIHPTNTHKKTRHILVNLRLLTILVFVKVKFKLPPT